MPVLALLLQVHSFHLEWKHIAKKRQPHKYMLRLWALVYRMPTMKRNIALQRVQKLTMCLNTTTVKTFWFILPTHKQKCFRMLRHFMHQILNSLRMHRDHAHFCHIKCKTKMVAGRTPNIAQRLDNFRTVSKELTQKCSHTTEQEHIVEQRKDAQWLHWNAHTQVDTTLEHMIGSIWSQVQQWTTCYHIQQPTKPMQRMFSETFRHFEAEQQFFWGTDVLQQIKRETETQENIVCAVVDKDA